ncbi:MAG: DNA alkylation repair protein [Salinivirgaceae bacterium]|nr:DNA alkylation repair protein [Salinivirgaceae bacterium]
MSLTNKLFELQDLGYRDFQAKLMPTIDKNNIIGVRIPELRKLARQVAGTNEARDFLSLLPHRYYDENNLHAFIIGLSRNFDEALLLTNQFLPYIDNWATCDSFTPKVFGKHPNELLTAIGGWIESSHTYTVRYAIRMLMAFFLDERFKPEYAQMVAAVESEEYYIKMMIAWYFATALAKQYNSVIKYLTDNLLDDWCHNKAIQKAIESYRISDEQKAFLRTLKVNKV